MAETSKIEWTQASWNPWHGCIKVSPGCKNCYMYRDKERYGQDPRIVVRSKTKFKDPLKWKEPKTVFTCSWSDWFIEEADEWRGAAWEIIKKTPQHTYQILTKRPERIYDNLPQDWGKGYPNVWLGVSCENQETANERIPYLLNTPAALRFISAEPLLGSVNLRQLRFRICSDDAPIKPVGGCFEDYDALRGERIHGRLGYSCPSLDWVIVGGESGPHARPMDLAWARSIVSQCQDADIPVFVKQLGAWPYEHWPNNGLRPLQVKKGSKKAYPFLNLTDIKGGNISEWPADLQVRQMPAA